MPTPVLNTAEVAVVNPVTGRFDDSLAPPSVAANAAAAYASAVQAQQFANIATAAASQANSDPAAAASASAAAASAAAAATSASQAAASAAAAGTGGGGTASQSTIDASIQAQVSPAGLSGQYGDLLNKPPLVNSADDIGAVALISKGAPGGVATLDGFGHGKYSEAIPGTRFDVRAPNGVQPSRNTITTRQDIFIDWLMLAEPSKAVGYAILGDGWRREAW
jgi:hypothetical protein